MNPGWRQSIIKEETMKHTGMILLLGLLALTACNQATSPSELEKPQGFWALQALGGTQIPNPQNFTVRFGSDGQLSARVDCNNCTGSYEVSGNLLSISELLACTRAYCGEDSLDREYINALTSASRYVRRDSRLEIQYAGGTMTFTVAQ